MNNSNIWWPPWKCWLQRKWQQWSRTWNMNISKQFKNIHWTQIITNQTSFVNISQNLNEGNIPTSFVRQRGRPWWKPEREHSCKWDCWLWFKTKEVNCHHASFIPHISIFVKRPQTDLTLTIHFNSNPNIPAKLPGKNCEETFPQWDAATGFFNLGFSRDFVNAGF